MLHGVETDAFQCNLFGEPQAPGQDIGFDFWVRIVEIREHEVIVVPFLGINVTALGPAFCFVTEDLVDGCLVVVCIVIGAAEVVPMVLLLGVFFSSPGEVKAEPRVDLVGIRYGLVAIFFVDFLGFASFFVVCCRLVVEDWAC
jgi:hypothetical protein